MSNLRNLFHRLRRWWKEVVFIVTFDPREVTKAIEEGIRGMEEAASSIPRKEDGAPKAWYTLHSDDCGTECAPHCPVRIYEETGKWVGL